MPQELTCPSCQHRLVYVPPFRDESVRGPGSVAQAAALERARVVGVLDGWAHDGEFEWACGPDGVTLRTFLEGSDEPRVFVGEPDVARAKAAAAIEAGEV